MNLVSIENKLADISRDNCRPVVSIPKIVKITCQKLPQTEPDKIEQKIPYFQIILNSFLFRKFYKNYRKK